MRLIVILTACLAYVCYGRRVLQNSEQRHAGSGEGRNHSQPERPLQDRAKTLLTGSSGAGFHIPVDGSKRLVMQPNLLRSPREVEESTSRSHARRSTPKMLVTTEDVFRRYDNAMTKGEKLMQKLPPVILNQAWLAPTALGGLAGLLVAPTHNTILKGIFGGIVAKVTNKLTRKSVLDIRRNSAMLAIISTLSKTAVSKLTREELQKIAARSSDYVPEAETEGGRLSIYRTYVHACLDSGQVAPPELRELMTLAPFLRLSSTQVADTLYEAARLLQSNARNWGRGKVVFIADRVLASGESYDEELERFLELLGLSEEDWRQTVESEAEPFYKEALRSSDTTADQREQVRTALGVSVECVERLQTEIFEERVQSILNENNNTLTQAGMAELGASQVALGLSDATAADTVLEVATREYTDVFQSLMSKGHDKKEFALQFVFNPSGALSGMQDRAKSIMEDTYIATSTKTEKISSLSKEIKEQELDEKMQQVEPILQQLGAELAADDIQLAPAALQARLACEKNYKKIAGTEDRAIKLQTIAEALSHRTDWIRGRAVLQDRMQLKRRMQDLLLDLPNVRSIEKRYVLERNAKDFKEIVERIRGVGWEEDKATVAGLARKVTRDLPRALELMASVDIAESESETLMLNMFRGGYADLVEDGEASRLYRMLAGYITSSANTDDSTVLGREWGGRDDWPDILNRFGALLGMDDKLCVDLYAEAASSRVVLELEEYLDTALQEKPEARIDEKNALKMLNAVRKGLKIDAKQEATAGADLYAKKLEELAIAGKLPSMSTVVSLRAMRSILGVEEKAMRPVHERVFGHMWQARLGQTLSDTDYYDSVCFAMAEGMIATPEQLDKMRTAVGISDEGVEKLHVDAFERCAERLLQHKQYAENAMPNAAGIKMDMYLSQEDKDKLARAQALIDISDFGAQAILEKLTVPEYQKNVGVNRIDDPSVFLDRGRDIQEALALSDESARGEVRKALRNRAKTLLQDAAQFMASKTMENATEALKNLCTRDTSDPQKVQTAIVSFMGDSTLDKDEEMEVLKSLKTVVLESGPYCLEMDREREKRDKAWLANKTNVIKRDPVQLEKERAEERPLDRARLEKATPLIPAIFGLNEAKVNNVYAEALRTYTDGGKIPNKKQAESMHTLQKMLGLSEESASVTNAEVFGHALRVKIEQFMGETGQINQNAIMDLDSMRKFLGITKKSYEEMLQYQKQIVEIVSGPALKELVEQFEGKSDIKTLFAGTALPPSAAESMAADVYSGKLRWFARTLSLIDNDTASELSGLREFLQIDDRAMLPIHEEAFGQLFVRIVQHKLGIEPTADGSKKEVAEEDFETETIWSVISPTGLVCREACLLDSPELKRVGRGSVLRQISIAGNDPAEQRLHFELVEGIGPSKGWVSMFNKGEPLLQSKVVRKPKPEVKLEPVKTEEAIKTSELVDVDLGAWRDRLGLSAEFAGRIGLRQLFNSFEGKHSDNDKATIKKFLTDLGVPEDVQIQLGIEFYAEEVLRSPGVRNLKSFDELEALRLRGLSNILSLEDKHIQPVHEELFGRVFKAHVRDTCDTWDLQSDADKEILNSEVPGEEFKFDADFLMTRVGINEKNNKVEKAADEEFDSLGKRLTFSEEGIKRLVHDAKRALCDEVYERTLERKREYDKTLEKATSMNAN